MSENPPFNFKNGNKLLVYSKNGILENQIYSIVCTLMFFENVYLQSIPWRQILEQQTPSSQGHEGAVQFKTLKLFCCARSETKKTKVTSIADSTIEYLMNFHHV